MADRKVYINNGTAVVQVGAGNLSGLGDVAIATPTNGQFLTYNTTTSKWQNSSAGTGTVTSVGITPGTGVTVSGSPITTSGNIAVGLSTKLTAIENLSGAGFITQNGTGVIAGRTLQAGTGISIAHGNGSSQDPIITNSAPDQTVALTGAGATSISGTYPNFTITSTNTTYSLATSTVLGLIELGSDTQQTVAPNAVSATASRSYALQVNAAGQGVVNVPWTDTNSGGTVTSVALSGGTTGLTTSGGPVTTSGTITLAGTLGIANGGTGATTAAAARTNLGATTLGGNLFALANVAAISFPRFNADNTISSLDAASFRTAIGAGTSSTTGTVTSVGGTGTVSGLTLSGTVTTSGNLTLGGTLAVTPSNFASQTAKTVLAAPNAAAGVPTFRLLVASDIPTLNQNTTGTAAISTAATVTTSATASAFKVPFANTTASTTGNYGLLQDSEGTFTYNPSTNTLTVGTVSGALSGNATTATTLQTARTIQTNLASTSSASFNGSANITPGVTGTLPIANGGTGATTAAGALTNLGALPLTGGTVTGKTELASSSGDVNIGWSGTSTAKLDVRNGNGTVGNFVGAGGTFQGIAVQSNYGNSTTYSGVFYDAKNENGIVIANAVVDVQTDGGSAWGWDLTRAGSRTTDRRYRALNLLQGGTTSTYFRLMGADGNSDTGSKIEFVAQIEGSTQESFFTIRHRSSAANGNWYGGFLYNNNVIGSIAQNGTTATSYNTTSDYRLKENVQPLTGALARIAALKPVTYTWKSAPDEIGEGFIAHELQEVCPQAVTGEKDDVNEDGSIKPQSIDTSFLVATLAAAIQEQQAIIQQLQADIALLKNKI